MRSKGGDAFMTILHVLTTLDPDGAQRVALELGARVAPGSRIVGLRAGSGRLRDLAADRGVQAESLCGVRWDPRVFRRLKQIVHEVQPDVIHTHLAMASFVGRIVARHAAIPVVSTVHSMSDDRRRDFTWMERATSSIPRVVVAVSERVRADAMTHYKLPPERVAVIPNGIDVDRFRATGARRDVDVLFVGRLDPVKGLDRVLPALGAAARSTPLRIVAVGEGPARETWKTLAERSGAAVEWVGFDAHPEAWYRRAKVCLVPSRVEAFGLTAIEALAAGCDVLHSGVDALPEVCGAFGHVLPERTDEAAERILERVRDFCDNDARVRWVAERFSVDAMCRAYERLYGSVMSAVGSRP